MNRAGDLLAEALEQRDATRVQTIAKAEAQIAAIDAAETQRTAVTR